MQARPAYTGGCTLVEPGIVGSADMHTRAPSTRGYLLVALLAALGGGLAVAVVTRAIPAMMSRMMSEMMKNMMACMGENGLDPEEM
jgi:hypothetical protein